MEAALRSQVLTKLEQLPKGRIMEVLDFIEFILTRSSVRNNKAVEATDQEILRAIEAGGSLDFYYDDSQDVYTLQDGEPL
jgi:hypothetical protein